jgi:hypothetical protein
MPSKPVGGITNDDRNWMSGIAGGSRMGGGPPGIGQIERPVTASS